MRSGERRERGFALILLLVLVAVLGAATAHVVQLGHAASRRDAEQALLAAGEDFRAALLSWRRAERAGSANAASRGPAELADLLRDPRVPGVRRHLRRVPVDPLTGRAEWGLVREGGGIVAVYSLAAGRPIKRQGFAPWQAGFEEAETYAQWRFGLAAPAPVSRTVAPGGGL